MWGRPMPVAVAIAITFGFWLTPARGRQSYMLWETLPHDAQYNAMDSFMLETGSVPSGGVQRWAMPLAAPRGRQQPRHVRPRRYVKAPSMTAHAQSKDQAHLDNVKAERRRRREGALVETSFPLLTKGSLPGPLKVNATDQENVSVADKTNQQMAKQAMSNATAFMVLSIGSILLIGVGMGILIHLVSSVRGIEEGDGETDANDPVNTRRQVCCCSIGPTTFMFLGIIVIFTCVGFWVLWQSHIMQDAIKELAVYAYLLVILVACACLGAIEVYTDIAYLTSNARTMGKATKEAAKLIGVQVPGADPKAPDGAMTSAAKHVYHRWGGFSKGIDQTMEAMISGRTGGSAGFTAASAPDDASSAAAAIHAHTKVARPQPAATASSLAAASHT